jgi:hypothetical protein
MTRLVLLFALFAACKGDPPNEERRLPNLHPPPTVTVPSSLRIEVEAPGGPTVIDTSLLETTKPDFTDDERAAWRLDHLIPAAARPGTKIVAEGQAGVSVTFRKDEDRVPVVLLNRRGEIHVQLIEVKNPFPGYHREGGRMRRPPADVLRVVTEVSRIRVLADEPE